MSIWSASPGQGASLLARSRLPQWSNPNLRCNKVRSRSSVGYNQVTQFWARGSLLRSDCMSTDRFVLKAAAGLLLSAMPGLGHHSFMAEYDESRLINLSGTVTKVYWKNPHVTFDLDVKDGSGKVI